jgi:serine/threonine protein kinase
MNQCSESVSKSAKELRSDRVMDFRFKYLIHAVNFLMGERWTVITIVHRDLKPLNGLFNIV